MEKKTNDQIAPTHNNFSLES